MARVAAATGRPTSDRAIRRMVQRAFVNHARYWLEMLRSPYYRAEDIPEIIHVDDWERWEPVLRGGAVIALPHLGNFEPYGHFIVAARPARRGAGRGDGSAGALRLPACPTRQRQGGGGAAVHARPGRCWPRCAAATWWR